MQDPKQVDYLASKYMNTFLCVVGAAFFMFAAVAYSRHPDNPGNAVWTGAWFVFFIRQYTVLLATKKPK